MHSTLLKLNASSTHLHNILSGGKRDRKFRIPEASFKTPCFYRSYQHSETFLTSHIFEVFIVFSLFVCACTLTPWCIGGGLRTTRRSQLSPFIVSVSGIKLRVGGKQFYLLSHLTSKQSDILITVTQSDYWGYLGVRAQDTLWS